MAAAIHKKRIAFTPLSITPDAAISGDRASHMPAQSSSDWRPGIVKTVD
jgi:hypothetical protein